jgi:hypothetical protein
MLLFCFPTLHITTLVQYTVHCVTQGLLRGQNILQVFYLWRMVSSGMLHHVALVITDVSEALGNSETSVLTRATWRNIPEDTIFHSHHRENLKSYIFYLCSLGDYVYTCKVMVQIPGFLFQKVLETWIKQELKENTSKYTCALSVQYEHHFTRYAHSFIIPVLATVE